MKSIRFTYDGHKGLIEPYQGGAFIFLGSMGFHLSAVAEGPLRAAILAAMHSK